MAKKRKNQEQAPTMDDIVKTVPTVELTRMRDLMVELCQISADMDTLKDRKDDLGAELGAYFVDHKLRSLRLEDFLFSWVRGSMTTIDASILAEQGVPLETIEKATITTPWKSHAMVVRNLKKNKEGTPSAERDPRPHAA